MARTDGDEMTIAELKTLRAAAGLSQSALGERLGMGQVSVARWETGVTPIRRAVAIAIRAVCKGEAEK